MTLSNHSYNRCGWVGSILTFLSSDKQAILESLKHHSVQSMKMSVSESQITAWSNCVDVLQQSLNELGVTRPDTSNWSLVFEYELPRERGRRPDVVVLGSSHIFVLEFKDYSRASLPHIDQVASYARDLQHYHSASHDKEVIPVLVLTQASDLQKKNEDVWIVSGDQIASVIGTLFKDNDNTPVDPIPWIVADYEPLPSLVEAARNIFRHEPLPQIKRARSAGIPDTIRKMVTISTMARNESEYHLALVTGVPGAGKTLVGIQFVYDNYFSDTGSRRSAVFLSGNGPLVQVLQHALKSSVFVQDVHGFLREYGGNGHRTPEENVFIFDEAQRAWDIGRVREKRGTSFSEPEDFLNIRERKSWALMVGLIGEGQEIHLGEEAGLGQWDDAIKGMKKPWVVHCPSKISKLFKSAASIHVADELNLNVSLRSHLSEHLQDWVGFFLNGEIQTAVEIAPIIRSEGYKFYITSDLSVAKNYVLERYRDELDKRYGLIASSKAKNLPRFGIHNEFQYTQRLRVGPWYNDDPASQNSCCQLREVATEFSCQGLELDFPIVCWGDDLTWNGTRWVSPPPGSRSRALNPHQLRVNSYRVLLTRGRDGMVIFVPNEEKMRGTGRILLEAGAIWLR